MKARKINVPIQAVPVTGLGSGLPALDQQIGVNVVSSLIRTFLGCIRLCKGMQQQGGSCHDTSALRPAWQDGSLIQASWLIQGDQLAQKVRARALPFSMSTAGSKVGAQLGDCAVVIEAN